MPTISMFYGILVSMYAFDTAKHRLPHIHVRYKEFKVVLGISDGELIERSLPNRQMKLVQAWVELSSWRTGLWQVRERPLSKSTLCARK